MLHLVLIQKAWEPRFPAALRELLQAAVLPVPANERDHVLALLPQAEDQAQAHEQDVVATLQAAATGAGVMLAASARVLASCANHETPTPAIVAWLIDTSGAILLRTPKIMPELLEGAREASAASRAPAAFAVAKTALGQIALLPGEDILQPHFARACMLNGAELLLNPAREFHDRDFELRQRARAAKAYENLCWVATASPNSFARGNVLEKLPPASGAWDHWLQGAHARGDEDFIRLRVDLDEVRHRRQEFFGNLCVSIRPTIYARALSERAAQASTTRPVFQQNPLPHESRYDVVLGQVYNRSFDSAVEFESTLQASVDHALATIERVAEIPSVRLAVFPEFFLQGTGGARSAAMWDAIPIPLDGPTFEQLGRFASDKRIYLTGAVLERNVNFPGRFFNTAFILNDSGDLIHVYRKIQCADLFGGFPVTTPGSVLDRYLELYGYEGLFPVANTPLGRIATTICFDMNFPELHRELVHRGAEVLCHPTSEPHNIRRDGWENSRRVRAWENLAYVLSANVAGQYRRDDTTLPLFNSRGCSRIVDFNGHVQSEATYGGACAIQGQINLNDLRAARADLGRNLCAWDTPVVYAPLYASKRGLPDNTWPLEQANPYIGGKALKEVIRRYTEQGIFVAPSYAVAENSGEGLRESAWRAPR